MPWTSGRGRRTSRAGSHSRCCRRWRGHARTPSTHAPRLRARTVVNSMISPRVERVREKQKQHTHQDSRCTGRPAEGSPCAGANPPRTRRIPRAATRSRVARTCSRHLLGHRAGWALQGWAAVSDAATYTRCPTRARTLSVVGVQAEVCGGPVLARRLAGPVVKKLAVSAPKVDDVDPVRCVIAAQHEVVRLHVAIHILLRVQKLQRAHLWSASVNSTALAQHTYASAGLARDVRLEWHTEQGWEG